MSLRPQTLELAILGRLMQGPLHGYYLRKYLTSVLGALHSISYGSLYPALRRLTERGLICDCGAGIARLVGGRSRRVYHITPQGEEYLVRQLSVPDSAAWTDDDGELGNTGVDYLMRQVTTIGGGTTEMARNVISERVLGMPRD